MLDKLLTNKYFCIAILIALLVILYLYSQKKSCDVEGLQNLDLTPLGQELAETPWTNSKTGKYKKYNNRFDKFADRYSEKKLKELGYSFTDYLKRSDQRFEDYLDKDYNILPKTSNKKGEYKDEIPKPLDDRPDLSQCQPCVCDEDSEDSEMERYILKKLLRKRNKKN